MKRLIIPLLFCHIGFNGMCEIIHKVSELPEPITNNAVALVNSNNSLELYSFNGLRQNKSWKDISNKSYRYKNQKWQQIDSPENSQPVLASTAVAIGTKIYLIGGYTVDENLNEKSTAEIYQYDTVISSWKVETKMPIPVDDTVALVYANRYIYLISGWYDVDNVSDVQVYDTLEKKWFNATPFTAPAVFGHAGGILGNNMLICDGVKVVKKEKGKDFIASPVCVSGEIDTLNPRIIKWKSVSHHSQTAYYRMAAVGDLTNNRIIFAGGSNNPYNFNGIGYNGDPSEASSLVFSYDFDTNEWNHFDLKMSEKMDHRSMLTDGKWFYIIGGMQQQQKVTNHVSQFKLPN